MSIYFCKIDRTIDVGVPDPSGVINTRFGVDVQNKFVGLTYICLERQEEDSLLSLIPAPYRKDFFAFAMIINDTVIPPHTDDGVTVSLNIYVQTASARTKFYNVKSYDELKPKLRTQISTGRNFAYEQLTEIDSFVAKDGDIWLLDVTKPHSVHCAKKENRLAYVVQSSSYTYNEVKSWFS